MAVCSRISRKLRTLQVQTQDFHTDWPMEQDLQPAAVPTERVTSCSTKKQHWEFVFNVPNTKELHLSRQNHQQAFPSPGQLLMLFVSHKTMGRLCANASDSGKAI